MQTERPRRSALYMPGSNDRALDKARSLPCDVVIMDLEDGVADEAKGQARSQIVAEIGKGGYGRRELAVRINGVGSAWFEDDIAAIGPCGAHALQLPKVDGPDAVRAAAEALDDAGAPEGMAIWCMIETARGVLNADVIAGAHPRVGALLIGGADLTKDLHALHTPDRLPLLTSIQLVILAARANGCCVLDSPFFDLSDDEGFRAACRQGRELGFDGKTLIHPKTIADANAAFGPTAGELDWARRIKAAHDAALAQGQGVTLVDGKLVEGLHVAEAQRLVALAETIAAMEADSAG